MEKPFTPTWDLQRGKPAVTVNRQDGTLKTTKQGATADKAVKRKAAPGPKADAPQRTRADGGRKRKKAS